LARPDAGGGVVDRGSHARPASRSPPSRGSSACREANAPGTRLLIAEVLDSQREQLSALFDQTLEIINDAFQARKIFVVRGVTVDGGPDHYARLEAAKLFIQLISSRR
jgi:hypothetical protein